MFFNTDHRPAFRLLPEVALHIRLRKHQLADGSETPTSSSLDESEQWYQRATVAFLTLCYVSDFANSSLGRSSIPETSSHGDE